MSTKKEKVALQRGDDFDFVDAELTAALAELDQANKNVAQVLDGDEDEEGDAIEGTEVDSAEPPVTDTVSTDNVDAPSNGSEVQGDEASA